MVVNQAVHCKLKIMMKKTSISALVQDFVDLANLSKNDLLLDALVSDDVDGFTSWLDSVYKDESGLEEYKNSTYIYKNEKSVLYKKLLSNSVHCEYMENTTSAHTVLGAIFKLKAFKCFDLLAKYKNAGLLHKWHFNMGGLLYINLNVAHIDLNLEKEHKVVSELSFVKKLLSAPCEEIVDWLNASPGCWRELLKTDINYEEDCMKNRHQDWFGVANALSDLKVKNSEFVVAMFAAGFLKFESVESILCLPEMDTFCHPETQQRVENLRLKSSYSGSAKVSRHAL